VNLASIAAGAPFLDAVARAWLARHRDPSAGMILLPTRRAARALAEAFLNAHGGRALLLPRITAIGALDEAPLALRGALDIPPAIGAAERLALLSQLILAMGGRDGAPRGVDRAWPLAAELAALMDEAERAEIDLRLKLPDAADAAYAQHWERTLDFLRIVTEHWPRVLAERGLMNPAARQVALLDAQAQAWTEAPPAEPVWAAGMTSAMPSVARLLRAVAGAGRGLVLLPGFEDGGLGPQAPAGSRGGTPGLPSHHPQAALDRLVTALGARAEDVGDFGVAPRSRAALLSRALLPAAELHRWQEPASLNPSGLFRLAAADEQAEATAIALILRDALEVPAHRAALVTPDRALAARVVAELVRFGVVADDSAGEPLAETPPGAFLRLLARAYAERLAPVPLLAVLKHPLAAAGLAPPDCRARVRALEMLALRGPRPLPDRAGLRRAIELAAGGHRDLLEFFERIDAALAPAARMDAAVAQSPAARFAALIEAAEALAASDEASGPARLWAGEEGEALAQHLAEIRDALPALDAHDMPPDALPGLLDAVLEGAVVRSRRALRGRAVAAEHPRLFIWGLLEARLQAVDVVVLAGLAEGVWPPAAEPGPWLSRPMRAAIGLPSPEERIGQAAHDFVMAACCAPVAVLSCPARRDGAPAVPARFLVRLETMLAAQGLSLKRHPAAGWAGLLDQPETVTPATRPAPRPPVHQRPVKLSVTEVETWLRDPYAIYARHVLRLRPLDPLDAETEAADYGNIVHAAMHRLIAEHADAWPPDAATFRAHFERALLRAQARPALLAWWQPRVHRIADWLAAVEAARPRPVAIAAEVAGIWQLRGPARPFHLKGRADRIERRADGMLALIDYKTGSVPSAKQVNAGFSPQLPLLAAMAQAGCFDGLAGAAGELAYWRLTGGRQAGELQPLFDDDPARISAAAEDARAGLRALIERYADDAQPYVSLPWPSLAPGRSDYALLARVAEWSGAQEEPS
jgi:ATP-dependent helicase/nuclease subunit B